MGRGRRLISVGTKSVSTVCPLCGFTCISETAMRLHAKKTHPSFKIKPADETTDNAVCGICKKGFPSKHQLDTHFKHNPTHNF